MSDVPDRNPDEPLSSTVVEPGAAALLERLRAATLGEYEILGELGRGGMATVYLAHEISLDRKVAIKVMSPGMVNGSGLVERFKREARTAANLSHPNIIPIYSVREVDGLLFCVIKLVKGTPLDTIMRELGQLPVPMVEAIIAQVGDALGYAHRQGVVHRDIKPGNILIDDEGWAVVTDFGIAKVQESEGLTMTGVAVGTPTYMSPEQCSGDVVTGASDQYSLGIVAYEMLAGRPPFTGTTMMALMYSHFHDVPPPLDSFRPDCPPQLREGVMRTLNKNPADRWLSVEEATMAMGARPLPRNDPTRDQLITLARTGVSHRIVSQVQTPRSPIPLTRKSGEAIPAAAARRSPALLAAGAVALLGAGFVLARVLSPGAVPTPSQSTASDSTQVISAASTVASEPANTPPSVGPNPGGNGSVIPQATSSLSPPGGTTIRPQPAPDVTQSPTVDRPAAPPPQVSADTPVSRAESTIASPIVSSPQVQSTAQAQRPPAVRNEPVVPPAPEPQVLVRAVIQSFANALASSDLAAAQRLYPTMPAAQRDGFAALWRDGGTMTPRWTIADIAVTGDVATARIQGTNLVTARRGQSQEVQVALRARLERRDGEWRIVSLIN